MASIVLMLNSQSLALPLPMRPGFFINGDVSSYSCAIKSFDSASVQMHVYK